MLTVISSHVTAEASGWTVCVNSVRVNSVCVCVNIVLTAIPSLTDEESAWIGCVNSVHVNGVSV